MKCRLCDTSPRGYARLLSLLIAAVLTATLCACGGGEDDLLGYQKQNFQAQVRGEWRGTVFEGELVHTAAGGAGESTTDTRTDATGARDSEAQRGDSGENENSGNDHPVSATVTLTFTAPAAWRGITLTLAGDDATMALGDLSYDMTGEIGGTWFEIPALFTAEGDVTSVTAADGGLTEVTFTASDGERVTVTLDGETGSVRRIAGACGWVEAE